MPKLPTPFHAALLWVACLFAATVAGFVLLAAVGVAEAAAGRNPLDLVGGGLEASPLIADPKWLAASTVLNELALLATVAVFVVVVRPSRPHLFPLTRPSARGVGGALLCTFGVLPLAEVVGELVRRATGAETTVGLLVAKATQAAGPVELVGLFVALSIFPGIGEETVFRGFIHGAYTSRSLVARIAVPSVLFGLIHIDPPQVAATILLGVTFGLARHYTGTLVTPIVVHAVYNAAVVAIVRVSDVEAQPTLHVAPVLLGLVVTGAGVTLLRSSAVRTAAGTRDD